MHTTLDDAFAKRPDLRAAAERISQLLENATQGSVLSPKISWTVLGEGNGSTNLRLQLVDDAGTISGDFKPSDLQDEDKLESRLLHLWNRLLAKRTSYHLGRLHQLVEQMEEN